MSVEHFKAHPNTSGHRAWCSCCRWRYPDEASMDDEPGERRGASGRAAVRRAARKHTESTGHTTRVQSTSMHGYRSKP